MVSGVTSPYVKAGDTSVQLAGAALLALLGFRRANVAGSPYCCGNGDRCDAKQGGMLAIIFMLIFALLASGRLREFSVLFVIVAMLTGIAYVFNLSIPTNRMRDISAEQLIDNFASIFGLGTIGIREHRHGASNGGPISLTIPSAAPISGPAKDLQKFGYSRRHYIRTPKRIGTAAAQPSQRTPYHSRQNRCARFYVVATDARVLGRCRAHEHASRNLHGDNAWANFFLLIFCYELGFVIDAAFDVALEGPMVGIWFRARSHRHRREA